MSTALAIAIQRADGVAAATFVRDVMLEIASRLPKHAPAIYKPIVYEHEHIYKNINMLHVEILAENYVDALIKFRDLMDENMTHDVFDLRGWELWKIEEPFDSKKYPGKTVGKKSLPDDNFKICFHSMSSWIR